MRVKMKINFTTAGNFSYAQRKQLASIKVIEIKFYVTPGFPL